MCTHTYVEIMAVHQFNLWVVYYHSTQMQDWQAFGAFWRQNMYAADVTEMCAWINKDVIGVISPWVQMIEGQNSTQTLQFVLGGSPGFSTFFKWIVPCSQTATVKLVAQAFSRARDDTTDFYISAGSSARAGFSTPPLPHGAHQRSSVKWIT